MKHLLTTSLLCALLLSGCKNDAPVQKWEYKTLEMSGTLQDHIDMSSPLPSTISNPTEQLNALGKEGWELVTSYTEIKTTFPNFGNKEYNTGIKSNTKTYMVTFVLKRQSQENEQKSDAKS